TPDCTRVRDDQVQRGSWRSSYARAGIVSRPSTAITRSYAISGQRALLRKPSEFGHLSLCTSQHLRSVHILPPGLADIDGMDFIIAGHQSNSISQAAIAAATAGLRSLEIVKDFKWANKQADINGVVIAKVFPDVDDLVSAALD